jgi:hydrogenase maturation protease
MTHGVISRCKWPPIASPELRFALLLCRTRAGRPHTLILGLGNDILTDDAVGLLVARGVAPRVGPDVDVREAAVAGFDLVDLLAGYERAIIVDAIKTTAGTPGDIYRLTPADLPRSEGRLAAIHEIGLPAALDLGRLLGHPMPAQVVILAVEIAEDRVFGEQPTPAVAAAVAPAVDAVLRELADHAPCVRGP